MIDDLHSILLKNVSQARAAVEAVQAVSYRVSDSEHGHGGTTLKARCQCFDERLDEFKDFKGQRMQNVHVSEIHPESTSQSHTSSNHTVF